MLSGALLIILSILLIFPTVTCPFASVQLLAVCHCYRRFAQMCCHSSLHPSVDKQSAAIGESVTCTVLLFYFIKYDVISIIFNVNLFIKHLFQ